MDVLKVVLERKLKCSFCEKKFTNNIAKLLPECNKSICQACENDLKSNGLNKNGEFKCKWCSDIHKMPSNGLPISQSIVDMIKSLESDNKTVDAINLDKLREKLKHIELNCNQFKSFFEKRETKITEYCNNIRSEIQACKEKQIVKINLEFKLLMNEIDKYEKEQIQLSSKTDFEIKNWSNIISEVNEIRKNCERSIKENMINNNQQLENEMKKLIECNSNLEKNLTFMKEKQLEKNNLTFTEFKDEAKTACLGRLNYKNIVSSKNNKTKL